MIHSAELKRSARCLMVAENAESPGVALVGTRKPLAPREEPLVRARYGLIRSTP
jgi:hypothetical protein